MPAVGLLSIELHFPEARSLKDKRMILRSVKEQLRKLNVALAEIEHQNLWQRARRGVVAIATTRDSVDRSFETVVDKIERQDPGTVIRTELEWLM